MDASPEAAKTAMHRMRNAYQGLQSTVQTIVPGANTMVWDNLFHAGYEEVKEILQELAQEKTP